MPSHSALIPTLVITKNIGRIGYFTSLMLGVIFLAVFAQITIPLPWTPVPITGQTFAIAIIGTLWGRKLAPMTVASYLFLGYLGFPIFANFQSGLSVGPTAGYLVGMFFSSFVMGHLVETFSLKSFFRTFLIVSTGSFITFTCGLIGLSFFVPSDSLLYLGLYPFLIGDLLKTGLSSSIVFAAHKYLAKDSPKNS